PFPDADLSDLLRHVDVLVVNETEASALLGASIHDAADAARSLLALGPRTAVLTLGASGAVAASDEITCVEKGFPTEAIDTVGAGDAFCAALAVALGSGAPIVSALRRACAAGSLATTRTGAQS